MRKEDVVGTVVPSECKVALLAGGTSGERDISLASGEGARAALEQAGFQVVPIDPAEKADVIRLVEEPFDVAFLCLHGKMGEDGTVQGLLDVIGLPYTGSGVLSSALAMDKAKAKIVYASEGIPTPRSATLVKGAASENVTAKNAAKAVGFPCVVKPATEGSALGVYIVENMNEYLAAVEKAFEIDSELLVETYVSGTEVTVAVLGNDQPYALPVIEIVPVNAFYDFESKYVPGASKHLCPVPIDDRLTEEVQDLAILAHKALGCRGMSRSDFIIDADGRPWILETNTIPGMTETSLLPDAGRAAGIEFPELCTKLIELALE